MKKNKMDEIKNKRNEGKAKHLKTKDLLEISLMSFEDKVNPFGGDKLPLA